MNLRNTFNLGVKELRGLWRDPVMLVLIVYSFSLSIWTSANVSPEALTNAAISIVDEDQSHLSARITSAFYPPYFVEPQMTTTAEMDRRMDQGLDTFALNIPPDFARDVLAGKNPAIQLNIDATRMSQAFTGGGYIQQIVSSEVSEYVAGYRAETALPVDLALRARYNPSLDPKWFGAISAVIRSITMLSLVLTGAALNKLGVPTVTATLRAMETAGVVKTLAEPNLTAISGESATFVSGGEFPIPTGVTCQTSSTGTIGNCVQTVSFKKFGISLNFTPVVLSEGRISLKVMTEVSEVSMDNALTGGQGGTTIPSIKTRRADTTLEVPSGGSIAMAGLIQEQTKQAINGMPGVDQIPVLGQLFRSQDFVNNETELMVIVTPYVVRAVAQKELSRPDDGFAPASDAQSALLARVNRIYGVAARAEPIGTTPANFGFIID